MLGAQAGDPESGIRELQLTGELLIRCIDRPGRLTTNDAAVLSGVADIRGAPHQFIVSHCAIRDNDVLIDASANSPSRQATVDAMVALVDLLRCELHSEHAERSSDRVLDHRTVTRE